MTIQLPVPYDYEHKPILSPRAQGLFLENLSLNGNVRLACRAARVSPQTAYRARRAQPAFARAWDAALLAARTHAEEVLADRALNGWEEGVFYHGEEVATRRRYSDRLLLAHLARLDRLAERADMGEALGQLDAQINALRAGEGLPDLPAAQSTTQPSENLSQDPVPCVPSCRNCGGDCGAPDAEMTEEECELLSDRQVAMEEARPEGAKAPYELARDHPYIPAQDIEDIQLAAFEDGHEEWWLVVPTKDEWEDAGS